MKLPIIDTELLLQTRSTEPKHYAVTLRDKPVKMSASAVYLLDMKGKVKY